MQRCKYYRSSHFRKGLPFNRTKDFPRQAIMLSKLKGESKKKEKEEKLQIQVAHNTATTTENFVATALATGF